MPLESDDTLTSPGFPPPWSDMEEGVEATAIRGRLATRLFGAQPTAVAVARYEIIERIGAGGMGVVYSARDRDLDRRVALKILSDQPGDDPKRRQRFFDEARTLARLSHPNVVQIYEVGEHQGRVFLALELIDGENLVTWQQEPGRSWQEILAAYLEAARGLAAAHSVGVIHRDVKPANILIARDGRVRVVDFGLARAPAAPCDGSEDLSSTTYDEILGETVRSEPGGRRLATLGVAGTPAYMSPEQALGLALDARSDVFSLCVALFEGLFGSRPFELAQIAFNPEPGGLTVSGLRARIPRGSKVPRWIVKILTAGLQPARERRLADMGALIAALEAGPRRIRRRRGLLAAGFGLSLLGGGIAALPPGPAVCPAVSATIPGVWDPTIRATIHRGFAASGLPFAELAWRQVRSGLDDAVVALSRERREVCRETRALRSRRVEHFDRATSCLKGHERALRTLTARLASGDPAVITQAHVLIRELEDPGRCSDPEALAQERSPPPPELRARLEALGRGLDELRFLTITADYEAALARGEELVAAAAIDGPTLARALHLRGVVDARRGEGEAAVVRLLEAANLAEGQADDPLAIEILGELMEVATHGQRDLDAAQIYAALYGAKIERLGVDGTVLADYLDRQGELALALGRPQEALAEHRRATPLRPPSDLLGRARNLKGIANALAEGGDLEASIATLERAGALLTTELGAEHPATVLVDFNLALSLRERAGAGSEGAADRRRAEGLLRGALAVELRHSGEHGLGAARTRVALADLLSASGRIDEARGELQRAQEVLRGDLPATGEELANALGLAINLEIERRDWPAAAAATTALIRLQRERGQSISLELLINAGQFLLECGDVLAAIPYFDQAIVLASALAGDSASDSAGDSAGDSTSDSAIDGDSSAGGGLTPALLLAYALRGRGQAYLLQGEPRRSAEFHAWAYEFLAPLATRPPDLEGELLWGWAQALALTRDRSQARYRAKRAQAILSSGVPDAPALPEIAAFLATGVLPREK